MSSKNNFDVAGDKTGSKSQFDKNWQERSETLYNHWTKGSPKNQVQLAFRSHWQVFQELMGQANVVKGDCLEVGCGRGSLSSYFVDDGWHCTLLDYSQTVLDSAEKVFLQNEHAAKFVNGDANQLPFEDNSYDVVTSIGLLEHFEDVLTPISEQLRVLKPGGIFLGYIVPERPDNLQKYFDWVNSILKLIARVFGQGNKKSAVKEEVFRSDNFSEHYLKSIAELSFTDLKVFGMYSLPMLSHSPEFPFTLLPRPVEWTLTKIFQFVLFARRMLTGKHGWICSEKMGQAFLISFTKPT